MNKTATPENRAAVGGSRLQRIVRRLLCATIGHRMRYTEFETRGIASPAECSRCGHHQPGIEWPKPPPMPKVKPARRQTSNHWGY